MSLENIKSTVRKLMAVTGCASATDGEIENAMSLAMKLIDAHHLDAGEFEQKNPDAAEMAMGRSFAHCHNKRLTTWESFLSHAITHLFGTLKGYVDSRAEVKRHNGFAVLRDGKPVVSIKIVYYGPANDAAEAAELFEEWSMAIATMGVARWGGVFRGEGAGYCQGFASALYEKAKRINQDRRLIPATAPKLVAGSVPASTAITLVDRNEAIRRHARAWLSTAHGVNLGSRRGSGTGASTSSGAFAEGRAHGSAASFGRRAGGARLALPA